MLSLYRLLVRIFGVALLRRLDRPDAGVCPALPPGQRLGRELPGVLNPVWLHAASVGEINAARGLIEALLAGEGAGPLLLSSFTATGAAQAQQLFGDRVTRALLPLDRRDTVQRWLDTIRPRLLIVMETEIWPELYHQMGQRGLPLILVNARLSDRAFRRARRVRGLFRQALASVSLAICQTETDAERFRALGLPADRIRVAGNLKFANPLPPDIEQQAQQLGARWPGRRVWVAGSTREGEEATVLEAQKRLRRQHPDALLVLAPRHPARAAAVAGLIEGVGLRWQGLDEAVRSDTDVVLIDRIGPLLAAYAAGTAAFVGGSLIAHGGHNLLEPAALGRPVLAGPWLDQQRAAAEALRAAGALVEVSDALSLENSIAKLWAKPEQAEALGAAAEAVVAAGSASLAQTLELLKPWIVAPAALDSVAS